MLIFVIHVALSEAKVDEINTVRILMTDDYVLEFNVVMHKAHLVQSPKSYDKFGDEFVTRQCAEGTVGALSH